MFLLKRSQFCNLVNLKQISSVFGKPFNKYYFSIVHRQFNSSLNEIEKSRNLSKFYLDNLYDLHQEIGKNVKLTYVKEDAYTKHMRLHHQTAEDKILSKTKTVDYHDLRYKYDLANRDLQQKLRYREEIKGNIFCVFAFMLSSLLLFLYYLYYLM